MAIPDTDERDRGDVRFWLGWVHERADALPGEDADPQALLDALNSLHGAMQSLRAPLRRMVKRGDAGG